MRAEEEYRSILVKDILCAVAVVHVPICDEHSTHAVHALCIARPDRDVVEQAKSHAFIGCGVVARGSNDGERVLARTR